MTIEYYKNKYKDGTIYYRSICKYEINGMNKQITVDAYHQFSKLEFLKTINNKI